MKVNLTDGTKRIKLNLIIDLLPGVDVPEELITKQLKKAIHIKPSGLEDIALDLCIYDEKTLMDTA